MSEQAVLVLSVLAQGSKHGYAIVRAVRTLSEDRVTLPVATLYGVLDRLLADGLAELDREEVHRGRLRRYYRITDAGLDALASEAERMAANLRVARSALRSRGLRPASSGGMA